MHIILVYFPATDWKFEEDRIFELKKKIMEIKIKIKNSCAI